MGSQYAGDPDTYPEDYTIPDDADPPTATAVNVGLEALGDRTECLRTKGLMMLMRTEFLDDGSWNKPADLADDIIWVEICGGGGGGGFGGQSGMSNGANLFNSGGAGGGAALWQRIPIDISTLSVGDAVNIGLGAGGAGAVVAGDPGADGDSSSIDIPVLYPDGTWFARGGAGGAPGRATSDNNRVEAALGGPPMAGARFAKWWRPPTAVADLPPPLLQPGQGGHACVTTFPAFTTAGADSPSWLNGTSSGGGSKGTAGTTDGTYNGGGPGGGGGGGPFGAGGQGGNGGAGNASGNGGNATNGGNALVNSGAGGGGGGGAGYGSGTLGTNGHGGDGGKARAYLYWWKKGRVLP